MYNVASSLIVTIVSTIAVIHMRSYAVPVVVRVFIPAMTLPVAVGLMFWAVPGPSRWPHQESMRRMVRYSVPLGLATVLGTIMLQLHSLIVASMCSPEEFIVYANGAIEVPLIGIVTGAITPVIFGDMCELCHKGETAAALQLFHKASMKSACILFPATCFLLVSATPFIVLLYSEQYRASAVPFVIYLCAMPIRIVFYGAALMALGMARAILVRSIIDLTINGILCFVLVKAMGYVGAAVASVLSLYVWHVPFNLTKIGQGLGVSWRASLPFKALLRILLISVLCMPAAAVGTVAVPGIPLVRLMAAGILYWPLVVYLLYRTSFIVPPSWLQRRIPVLLRA